MTAREEKLHQQSQRSLLGLWNWWKKNSSSWYKMNLLMPWPGFEPGLLRPQRNVLTTIRSRLTHERKRYFYIVFLCIYWRRKTIAIIALLKILGSAVTRIRTWVIAATTQCTYHYTITADTWTQTLLLHCLPLYLLETKNNSDHRITKNTW